MKIKKIILNKEYSINGNAIEICNDTEGEIITLNTLSNIMQLSNYEKIHNVFEYFPFLVNDLNIKSRLNLSLILGNRKSKEYLSYINDKISFGKNLFSIYHSKYFPERINCYKNLHPVRLEDNILEKPIYHHISTTGRTSIKKGHNFLTMKKDNRRKLKPINNNDCLLEMDFKSCEPFFYLLSQGILQENVNDIYSWIADKISYKIENRDMFKRGILSIIYGASNETVGHISKINKKDIAKIKKIMRIDSFKSSLEEEYLKNGFIRNYYGRPIKSNANIVNYWIQSSAADYCSLAFNKFKIEKDVRFCFLIHDSVTFLAPNNKKDEYLKIDYLDYEGVQIPVKTNLY